VKPKTPLTKVPASVLAQHVRQQRQVIRATEGELQAVKKKLDELKHEKYRVSSDVEVRSTN